MRCIRGLLRSVFAFAIPIAVAAPVVSGQVTVSVDRLDGSEPGTPVPVNLVIVDVFVDVATTDVWTASGMRGVTSNGAALVYGGSGGPSLINPGLGNRFVTCVSKPRARNADARFNDAGAASGGRYSPTGSTAVATSTEVNVVWFASPPEGSGSPSFDGYIARIALDIAATGVDPATIVVAAAQPAGTVELFRSAPAPGSGQTLGTVAATFDVPSLSGINWGVYGQPGSGATGACCTASGCSVLTRIGCAAAGGTFQGDNVPCDARTYSPQVGCTFEDISATGTVAATASACDDCGESIPIGFSFTYFDTPHTSINVCSNGYLTFGSVLNEFNNAPSFPNTSAPNDMIAPYWDDWNPLAGGDVYYRTVGSAPNRRLIVQWNQVLNFNTANPATFEAILSENSNSIDFRYLAINATDTPTIGIENAGGTVGVNVAVGSQCATISAASRACPAAMCSCDFNHDGLLNSQDFFDFIACFFNGCP